MTSGRSVRERGRVKCIHALRCGLRSRRRCRRRARSERMQLHSRNVGLHFDQARVDCRRSHEGRALMFTRISPQLRRTDRGRSMRSCSRWCCSLLIVHRRQLRMRRRLQLQSQLCSSFLLFNIHRSIMQLFLSPMLIHIAEILCTFEEEEKRIDTNGEYCAGSLEQQRTTKDSKREREQELVTRRKLLSAVMAAGARVLSFSLSLRPRFIVCLCCGARTCRMIAAQNTYAAHGMCSFRIALIVCRVAHAAIHPATVPISNGRRVASGEERGQKERRRVKRTVEYNSSVQEKRKRTKRND